MKVCKEACIKLTISIFSVVCLIITANLFAQQENTGLENAAVYYQKAMDLLKYPESTEVQNKLQGIINGGWKGEDKEIENILEENEPSLNEFQRGVLLKKCDFDFGKNYKYLALKQYPNILKIRKISNLLLLKGRHYEKEESFDKAIDIYLSIFTFARHISQDNSLVGKMLALAVEKNAYIPLNNYLNSKEINKGICQKILTYLEDYEKQHFPARELIEADKAFFVSTMQMSVDGLNDKITQALLNVDRRNRGVALQNEVLRQAQAFADRYYGNFIKAIETNKDSDWEFAINEFNSLRKEVGNTRDSNRTLYDFFGEAGNIEKIANKFVTISLSIFMPNFKKAADTYYLNLNNLSELISLAQTKLND